MASETFDLLAAYEPGTLSSNTQARPLALHGGVTPRWLTPLTTRR